MSAPIRLLNFEALFNLSQSQRRLAHRFEQEAAKWEREGHRKNYAHCAMEARRLRRDAFFHIAWARRERNLA